MISLEQFKVVRDWMRAEEQAANIQSPDNESYADACKQNVGALGLAIGDMTFDGYWYFTGTGLKLTPLGLGVAQAWGMNRSERHLCVVKRDYFIKWAKEATEKAIADSHTEQAAKFEKRIGELDSEAHPTIFKLLPNTFYPIT